SLDELDRWGIATELPHSLRRHRPVAPGAPARRATAFAASRLSAAQLSATVVDFGRSHYQPPILDFRLLTPDSGPLSPVPCLLSPAPRRLTAASLLASTVL